MRTTSFLLAPGVLAASVLGTHCAEVSSAKPMPSPNEAGASDASVATATEDGASVEQDACSGADACAPSPTNACPTTAATACADKCVDTGTDLANCGTCGNACPEWTTCTVGKCECRLGQMVSGACVSEWANWPMPNPAAAGLPNSASYTVGADTVVDNVTHLEWQRVVPDATFVWADAKAYCGALGLAGKYGWRLPTVIELVSLVDFTQRSPAIDRTAFPDAPSAGFWSASSARSASNAWGVNFDHGNPGKGGIANAYRVRCVR